MKCPKCSEELKSFSLGEIKLDKCAKCSGVWFDKGEVEKAIDRRDKNLAWIHFDLWAEKEKFAVEKTEKNCPRCETGLATLKYGDSEVEIDICKTCGGIWLDNGEITKIVDYLEEAVDKKTVPEYLKEIAKEGERIFTDPAHGAVEAYHVLILTKLLEYRVLAENRFISILISVVPH